MTEMRLEPRRLGSTGPSVFPLALGCMGMAGMYGQADEGESIATGALTESLGALQVDLSPENLARIEEAIPASAVAGSRYDEHQMRMLASER